MASSSGAAGSIPAIRQNRATAMFGSWLYCSKNTGFSPLALPALIARVGGFSTPVAPRWARPATGGLAGGGRGARMNARLVRDRHVAGSGSDPGQPRLDRRKALQVEAALRCDVGVRIQGDVGDRVAVGDEELPVG